MSTMEDLIWKHYDGGLSESEAAELRAWLHESPEHLRMFLSAAQLHADLPAAAFVLTRTVPQMKRSARNTWVRTTLGLAAAIALMGSLAAMWLWHGGKAATMELALLRGTAEVMRGGERVSVAKFQSGDEVRVAADSAAMVMWKGEATSLVLGADSQVRVTEASEGKQIVVTRGRVRAQVAKQPAGRPMIVMTEHGRVEVVGTRFEVNALEQHMRVAVTSGRVQLMSRQNADATMIEAMQSGETDAQGRVSIAKLNAGESLSAGLLAHWPLREGAGDVAHDAAGGGRDARIENPDWSRVDGEYGLVFSRDGVAATSQRNAMHTPALDLPPVFTVALRLRCDSRTPRSQVLLANAPVSARSSGFALMVNYHPQGTAPQPSAARQSLVFRASTGDGTEQVLTTPPLLETGRWHSIVALVNQMAGTLDVFVDEQPAISHAALPRGFLRDAPLWFGTAPSASLPLAGSLREVRLYERLLAPDEIAQLARE